MEQPALRLLVNGKVQGVGFRWYVAEQARHLNLSGWVRNNPDGSVEICAAGREDALSALVRLVATGPRGAHVSGVERLIYEPGGELRTPFVIMHD